MQDLDTHSLEDNMPKKTPREKRQHLWRQIKNHKAFYLMLLPCIVFYIVFSYIPMGGLILAFKEFKYNTSLWGGDWVGLDYFKRFFSDPNSWKYIKNTLIISFMKLILALPFPIILALLFNEMKNTKVRNVFQTIVYLPHFLSWVVVIGLVRRILAPDVGLINGLVGFFGGDSSKFYMMDQNYFRTITFWSYVWKDIGWSSIIYFAAIMGIDPSLYEAAEIDGAGKLKQIWHITLTGIRPTIIILFIMSLGNVLSAGFDQVYLLQTPGNMELSEIIDTYVIKIGLQGGQFGYATAVGMMQGLIGLGMVLLVNYITHKKFDTSLW